MSLDCERIGKVGILGVPLGFGAGQTGSELGVNAMRLSNIRGRHLADHIRALGYEVTDHGDAVIVRPNENAPAGNPKHLNEMLASSANIIDCLTKILQNGELPVIKINGLPAQRRDLAPAQTAKDSQYQRNEKPTFASGVQNCRRFIPARLCGAGYSSF